MSTAPMGAGSRRAPGLKIPLPEHPMKACAFCEEPRRNRSAGWSRVVDGSGTLRGWTCAGCPRYGEPIRRVVTTKGVVRWRWTATATPEGARKAVQATGTADTLDDARSAVAAARARILAEGQWSRPTSLTVRALCERWLLAREKDVRPGGIRRVTLEGYRSALDAPLRHIGHRPAEDVRVGEVRELVGTLATAGGKWRRPLSARSIAYSLGSLSQAYRWGIEQGWVERDPTVGVRAPKRSSEARPKVIWSTAELLAFRDVSDGAEEPGFPWSRAGMRLTLCGLRRSEVLGLDWRHVDLREGTVTVAASRVKTGRAKDTDLGGPKTSRSHRVVGVEEIHPGTVAALRALWLAQGRPSEGLVILDAAGMPVDPDAYSRRFRALAAEAGVPDLGSIHRIRHTLASWGRDAGISERAMASLLGHDVVTHGRFYVSTDDDAAAVGARGLGELLTRSRTGS
ncbi:hypothetical protein BN12_1680001 [Nostocoides japonicum T1-X7]|uniref:Integrase family protein n=1 Tax=Nostocoides japonicum T1-X7 TaxID=1194083 RepID=A0A077LYT3_9MICO|nr:tyrosine-type recombinase/integrase [Tetrasphaera japonica]CCH77135.1 hypothetical protein BN12_1680001 [Tetrasphaera japonica T1-X7]